METTRFANPWGHNTYFLNLGHYDVGTVSGPTDRRDLYALLRSKDGEDQATVHFGARYGDEPHEYQSGEAFYSDGQWNLYVNGATAIAAARYFANHHKGNRL